MFAGGFLFACALVACGGGSSTAPPAAALATATPAVLPEAYLVYPPAGPYAANPDFPSVVLDVSGLNSSYKVTVAPTPIGIAVSYGLNFSPTSLPSPLGSPPPRPGPPLSYATVTMQTSGGVPLLQPVTTYTVTLAGCPTPDNSGNCATTQTINAGTFQTNCGVLPIPSVPPSGTLVYPPAGSTNVATTIGRLILQGIVLQNDDYFGPESVMLTSASGVIAAGTPHGGAVAAAESAGERKRILLSRVPSRRSPQLPPIR